MKKFELTSKSIINNVGVTLYQIKALMSFDDVRKGDLGGYVEEEENISAYSNAWIYNNAQVYGNARVYGNVEVYGNAQVCDNADVYISFSRQLLSVGERGE